jgi:hypothetical protein
LVAADDRAGDGIAAAEELRGEIEVALRDGFADARAADRRALEHDGRNGVDAEAVLVGEGGEAVGGAGAVLAEGPAFADGDFLQVGEDAGDFVDKLGGLHVTERVLEFDGDDGDGALRAHVGDFLLEGGEARRDAVRRDDGEGMRLEGERVDAAGEALYHGLVAEMDAVEDADGKAGDAGVRLELGEGNGADEHG